MVTLGTIKGRGRRNPWPGDVQLGATIFRLGSRVPQAGQGGQGGTQDVDIKNVPDSIRRVQLAALPDSPRDPHFEQTATWDDLSLGVGLPEAVRLPNEDKRYSQARNADLATGEWQKGPCITAFRPSNYDSTYGWEFFFEFGGDFYACGGRYLVKWVSDSNWSLVKDFNDFACGGEVPFVLDLEVVGVSATTTAAKVYFVFGSATAANNPKWARWDGTTWEEDPTSTTFPQYGDAVAVLNGGIMMARDGRLYRSVDSARFGGDTYSGSIATSSVFVGQPDKKVRQLIVSPDGNFVFVLKEEGIWLYDTSDASINQLFPSLTQATDSRNGKCAGWFEDDLYVDYNNGFYKIDKDYNLQPVGLDQNTRDRAVDGTNTQGRITAFAPHSSFHAYAGMEDTAGNAYLMKYTAWVPNLDIKDQEARTAIHVDTWHGSISTAVASGRIQALVKSTKGATEANPRMYMGCKDGYIRWFALPKTTNPTLDTNYTYDSDADGYVIMPTFKGLYRSESKQWHYLTINGRSAVAAGAQALVYYRSKNDVAYNLLGTATLVEGTPSVLPFPANLVGYDLSLKVVLHSVSTAMPIVTDMSLAYSHWMTQRDLYEMDVLASDNLYWRNGVKVRRSRDQLHAELQAIIDTQGTMNLRIHGMFANATCRMADYEWTEAYDDLTGGMSDSLRVQFYEVT